MSGRYTGRTAEIVPEGVDRRGPHQGPPGSAAPLQQRRSALVVPCQHLRAGRRPRPRGIRRSGQPRNPRCGVRGTPPGPGARLQRAEPGRNPRAPVDGVSEDPWENCRGAGPRRLVPCNEEQAAAALDVFRQGDRRATSETGTSFRDHRPWPWRDRLRTASRLPAPSPRTAAPHQPPGREVRYRLSSRDAPGRSTRITRTGSSGDVDELKTLSLRARPSGSRTAARTFFSATVTGIEGHRPPTRRARR